MKNPPNAGPNEIDSKQDCVPGAREHEVGSESIIEVSFKHFEACKYYKSKSFSSYNSSVSQSEGLCKFLLHKIHKNYRCYLSINATTGAELLITCHA